MEKEFVSWLVKNHLHSDSKVALGIGDDAAILSVPDQIVVSTDMIADGTHFETQQHSLRQIGHKAIAVNLSDLAAMGARPLAATINLNLPRSFDLQQAKELFEGIQNTATRFGIPIVGGDTNRWDGGLVIAATVFGTKYENARTDFWKMSGAQPNDVILVTGKLGGSILDKHIEFEPRIELAKYLIENFTIHAATDVTDSLSLDLAAIAQKSGCGFQLTESAIPLSDAAPELAATGNKTALEHALQDGEDFELVFCTSDEEAQRIIHDPNLSESIAIIGATNESGSFTIERTASSKIESLPIQGFVH